MTTTQLPVLSTGASSKGNYAFVSLGCAKNLVDSERMLGLLRLDGYQLAAEPAGSDFVVVNTCGFIESAREESYGAIREMLELKRRGETGGVIVSGCLAEREKQRLLETCPEIDSLVGVFSREEITKVADRLVGRQREQRMVFRPAPVRALPDRDRLRITPRHFAYLKISEGCDRLCTFCAIPRMRGKHASKPMEEVLAEARELVRDGVRELIIVAQDTTYYGMDIYGEPRLAELLRELDNLAGTDGPRWIRLLYLYPMYFTDGLIETLSASRRIIPYLDIPLQHINDTMLRRMQRRVNRKDTEALLRRLRETIPGLVLRTTFITGFPGETEQQFRELEDFVVETRFERMGVFVYSFEAGTPSARLPGHLPEEVKHERRERLMASQQQVAFEYNQRQVGTRREVLIDHTVEDDHDGPPAWVGRTYADAPDIDSLVFVTGEGLRPGEFVDCEMVAFQGYDLVAVAD